MAFNPADDSVTAPPPVKIHLDTPLNLDREKLIDSVYAAQVDLQLLVAWLKKEPEPTLCYGVLNALHFVRDLLKHYAPSQRRH